MCRVHEEWMAMEGAGSPCGHPQFVEFLNFIVIEYSDMKANIELQFIKLNGIIFLIKTHPEQCHGLLLHTRIMLIMQYKLVDLDHYLMTSVNSTACE